MACRDKLNILSGITDAEAEAFFTYTSLLVQTIDADKPQVQTMPQVQQSNANMKKVNLKTGCGISVETKLTFQEVPEQHLLWKYLFSLWTFFSQSEKSSNLWRYKY